MDHYKWTPSQISELTPYQIDCLCFHARGEHGEILRPELPEPDWDTWVPTYEYKLSTLNFYAMKNQMGVADYTRLFIELHEKENKSIPQWFIDTYQSGLNAPNLPVEGKDNLPKKKKPKKK